MFQHPVLSSVSLFSHPVPFMNVVSTIVMVNNQSFLSILPFPFILLFPCPPFLPFPFHICPFLLSIYVVHPLLFIHSPSFLHLHLPFLPTTIYSLHPPLLYSRPSCSFKAPLHHIYPSILFFHSKLQCFSHYGLGHIQIAPFIYSIYHGQGPSMFVHCLPFHCKRRLCFAALAAFAARHCGARAACRRLPRHRFPPWSFHSAMPEGTGLSAAFQLSPLGGVLFCGGCASLCCPSSPDVEPFR